MNTRLAVLSLFLALCCDAGFGQAVTPSITIGTHVLKLGMQEQVVLEQLGPEFNLRADRGSKGTAWSITKHPGSTFEPVGSLFFDSSHRLVSAMRNWEIDETSSKSLFYAINEATKSLESDGLTDCQISSNGASQMEQAPSGEGSGTVSKQEVLIDCGVKKIRIYLFLTDTPGVVPSSIGVTEWLGSK